jgi:hypothetical protein
MNTVLKILAAVILVEVVFVLAGYMIANIGIPLYLFAALFGTP